MRRNQRTFPEAEIVPASILAPLDCEQIFGRRAPLTVDLGCGDGAFFVALAEEQRARDFIGVERLAGRVRGAGRRIGGRGLTNARILRADILHAVQHFFPPGSVDLFHLNFPDPWPKRRHHIRRTFDASFLRAVRRALVPGGALRVATDEPDYFAAMQEVLAQTPLLRADDEDAQLPLTTFEARFRERGLPIHRLLLRKV